MLISAKSLLKTDKNQSVSQKQRNIGKNTVNRGETLRENLRFLT